MAAESSTVWDANLYLKFADARTRPALDLMGRLDAASGARPGHAIYDLGCGAGNISRILAERFPQAQVIGIDSSEEMLAKARSQTADKRVTFAKGDLTRFTPDTPPSILYSNAAYQWVDGAHRSVPRPAEAPAVGRAARHPDAAQPRGALACADASGREDGTVDGQARAGRARSAGSTSRRATTTC